MPWDILEKTVQIWKLVVCLGVSRVKQRKRGPAPTGINPIMAFRPLPPLRAAIEAYAKSHEISVSEAMRQLSLPKTSSALDKASV
jgi:hypothetical protein